jgi:YidC/Oxa1 family membrane protein insertase
MSSIYNLLSPLADFFFYILRFIHENLGISWSWSIVLLTVIVRIALIPLTWRQIKSMRAMQALQPQIKALQEKYKDNRQLLNQKTMEFYQENKVSPFGSCLPLLLQLPVFFGLFIMLNNAGKTVAEGAVGAAAGAFAPPNPTVNWLWIPDITKFNIALMFLYIASQFFASWQMARKGAGQQKIIAYFMPIVVGIFMFIGKWPAGLMIYWFTSNLWTIAQQYAAERIMPAPAVASAKEGPAKPKGTAASKAGPAKSGTARSTPAKTSRAKSGTAKSGGAKTSRAKSGTAKSGAAKPAAKSGGSSSGRRPGTQRKTSSSKGKRPYGGAGSTKGTSGT